MANLTADKFKSYFFNIALAVLGFLLVETHNDVKQLLANNHINTTKIEVLEKEMINLKGKVYGSKIPVDSLPAKIPSIPEPMFTQLVFTREEPYDSSKYPRRTLLV